FDDAKFIWLMRHPKTFMHSASSRDWFKNDYPNFIGNKIVIDSTKNSHSTRLTANLVGEMDKKEWKNLDQRIKCLWYWKYWNGLIKTELSNVPDCRKFFIKLETLKEQKSDLLKFLNIEEAKGITITRENRIQKKQKKKYNKKKNENYNFFEEEGYKIVSNELKNYY